MDPRDHETIRWQAATHWHHVAILREGLIAKSRPRSDAHS